MIRRLSTEFTYLLVKGRHAVEEIHRVASGRENVREFYVLGKGGSL